MGHLAGKDVYRRLGRKIDGLGVRAPWNETLRSILTELYSEDEADLVIRMPFGLATADRIARTAGLDLPTAERRLEGLCAKGLVVDLHLGGEYRYIASPLVIGIFEFTMMRTGEGLDTKRWARLFHDYIGSGSLWAGNLDDGQQLYLMRTIPHEEAIAPEARVEVLDYERAAAIVESHERFSVGICSCRHEKLHVGEKKCAVPLESCISFGSATDFLVRRRLARAADRTEMHDQLQRSREMGLVFNAESVRRDASFICQCCGCCCNVLLGISRLGYPGVVQTSRFIAEVDGARCEGCGKCRKACPIQAISLERLPKSDGGPKVRSKVDAGICLGCGVCALRCASGALRLVRREQRVLYPEDMFERTILQSLEVGTLQNLLFDDPGRVTHRFMRAFVGGALRLTPVKRALLSDALRSRFLSALRSGAPPEAGAAAGPG